MDLSMNSENRKSVERVLYEVKKIIDRFRPDVVNAHFLPNYGWMALRLGLRPWVLSTWGSDVLVNPHRSALHRWRRRSGPAPISRSRAISCRRSADTGRSVRSAACETAGMTVCAGTTNSEPSIGTGDRRPDASGSPSRLRMNLTPATLPSSPMISIGLARNSMRTPSRSVSPSSSSSTTSSERVRR